VSSSQHGEARPAEGGVQRPLSEGGGTRPVSEGGGMRLASEGGVQRPAEGGEVFGALADPTRRALLEAIAARPAVTATELAAGLPITRQAVAKHLAALSAAGLLERSRLGREVRYQLRPAPLSDAVLWMAAVGAQWDRRLAELALGLEGSEPWRAPGGEASRAPGGEARSSSRDEEARTGSRGEPHRGGRGALTGG